MQFMYVHAKKSFQTCPWTWLHTYVLRKHFICIGKNRQVLLHITKLERVESGLGIVSAKKPPFLPSSNILKVVPFPFFEWDVFAFLTLQFHISRGHRNTFDCRWLEKKKFVYQVKDLFLAMTCFFCFKSAANSNKKSESLSLNRPIEHPNHIKKICR